MQITPAKVVRPILRKTRLAGYLAVFAVLPFGLGSAGETGGFFSTAVQKDAHAAALTPAASATPPAFPGAVGFGATATGARGSDAYLVYHVTNLNDSGTGSFRDAVAHHGRMVVFDVGGYIHLLSDVSAESDLTICGQTAPGGIGFYGSEVSFYDQSNCIVRDLRFRDGSGDPKWKSTGATPDSSLNAVNAGNAVDLIFDHCSFEFAAYNNVDASGTGSTADLTFQNCIFADPIKEQQFNCHLQGTDCTFLGNIFANNHDRDPLAKSNLQYVNNTIYDYKLGYTTGNSSGGFNWDIINNYFIAGPINPSGQDYFFQINGDPNVTHQSAYAAGNKISTTAGSLVPSDADNTGAVVLPGYFYSVTSTPANPTADLPTVSAEQSVVDNLANAGALPRDDVDTQVINQVASLGEASLGNGSGAGQLFNTQNDTGLTNDGYGAGPTGGTAPPNTSGDGIADYWKTAVLGITNLNTVVPPTTDTLGYTKLEEYVNWLAVPHAVSAENSSVQIDLSQYTAGLNNPSYLALPLDKNTTIDPPGIGAAATTNAGEVTVSGSIATYTPTPGTVGLGAFDFIATGTNGTITNTVYVCTSATAQTAASATVTLSNLVVLYNGDPQGVTVTTIPPNLSVSITYNGSTTVPSAVGNYAVVATVTSPDYEGVSSGTFDIAAVGGKSASTRGYGLPGQPHVRRHKG